MKKTRACLPLAAALLLCACAHAPQTSSSVPAASERPETGSTTPASEAPAQTPAPDQPAGLADAGLPVLDYDEIRAVRQDTAPYFMLADGYYTMSLDGLWGLMRSDGTEVLPCRFTVPVTACAQAGLYWHALGDSSLNWEEYDALTAQLQASGDGAMCSGEHDGSTHYWYYDAESHQVQVDGGLFGGTVHALDAEDAPYGDYLPCRLGTFVDGQGDPNYYEAADPLTLVYANAAGKLLNDQTYEAAGCFYDQALAPACQGGKWLYLDRSGQAVTEAVYDATYGDAKAAYASPLLNGYAPVCRNGKWGLLNSAGSESVPCAYAGAAWDGSLLWLRQDDGWHAYTIPGAEQPART